MEPVICLCLQKHFPYFVIIVYLCKVLLTEAALPLEGFEFNCGHDVCVFPRDFCNIQKQHCESCTIDICNELGVSSQCSQRCKDLRGEVDTSPAQSLEWRHQLMDEITTLRHMVWIIGALLLLLIMFLIAKYARLAWKRTRDKQSGEYRKCYLPARSDDHSIDVSVERLDPTAPPQSQDMPRQPQFTDSSVSVYQPSSQQTDN